MGLLYPGDTDFEQVGPVEWQPNGWDLDRLIIRYQGREELLNAFINSRTQWSASTVDPNMFLESWPNDGHKQFPTVSLTYIGKKGGHATPYKNVASQEIATANYRMQDSAGAVEVELSYYAPTTTRTWIDKTPVSEATSELGVMGSIKIRTGRIQYTPSSRSVSTNPMSYFTSGKVTLPSYEELVPGKYYRNTVVTRRQLDPTA